MFDFSSSYIRKCMGCLHEQQKELEHKVFVYLHLNVLTAVKDFIAALHQNSIAVLRMNICNLVDYVDGDRQYRQVPNCKISQSIRSWTLYFWKRMLEVASKPAWHFGPRTGRSI
eukprot:gnl/MRDRNA2_/MRDRNA2_27825_c0_seq1.p1 gnl/MRDRNA2_/MRDRNA2_27825_c0~~gnl/MRDRNA2_/MRDRNA2_27825_c0_seq1.p1  ORF type:complete len:114 (+),score=11.47 gnl/MRDRNA2_/MRDRNA2_27825_c0_seq1:77-418(+)